MRVNNRVASSPVSDFLIDGMTFEVGGKNKKKKQIEIKILLKKLIFKLFV